MEGDLNYAQAGAILDNYALPAFGTGECSRRIKDTFPAASAEVAREYSPDSNSAELAGLEEYSTGEVRIPSGAVILALIVFILFLLQSRRRGSRSFRGRPFFGPFGGFDSGSGGGGFGGGCSGGGVGGGCGGGSGGGASR